MSNQEPAEKKRNSLVGMLGMLAIIAFKYKVFIISFGLMLGVYAARYGFPWALAVVLLLLMHEMGHFIWMQACGLKPRLPVFIPFVGAMTSMEELPKSEATQAWTALAGPGIGGACAAGCLLWGVSHDLEFLSNAAFFGVMLNLLQLLPSKPLDGGFVMETVAPWFRIPGALLLLTVGWWLDAVLLILLGVLGLFTKSTHAERYPEKASIPMKFGIFFVWLLLVVVLSGFAIYGIKSIVLLKAK